MIPMNQFDVAIEKLSEESIFIYQILEGIKLAAKQILEPKETWNLASGNDYHTYQSYNIPSPSRTKGCVVVMKDYDELLFKSIKKIEGITKEDYVNSWTYKPQDITLPATGAGRSGSLFFFSSDRRFIFKTIPHNEVQTLRAMLGPYCNFLKKHPNSHLMRFFALHRFRIINDFLYLVVANNINYSQEGLIPHQKYDLKGRVPKASTLKRQSMIAKPAKGSVWKDNQLNRYFYPDEAEEIIAALIEDAEFLRDQNCIDYSLLIGVHEVDKSGLIQSEKKNGSTPIDENVAPELSRRQSNSAFKIVNAVVGVGVPSAHIDFNEVYFIGIIDTLTAYEMKKKTAHYCKSFLWKDETLSTIPPDLYCQRFCNYIPTIIKTTEKSKGRVSYSGPASIHFMEKYSSKMFANSKGKSNQEMHYFHKIGFDNSIDEYKDIPSDPLLNPFDSTIKKSPKIKEINSNDQAEEFLSKVPDSGFNEPVVRYCEPFYYISANNIVTIDAIDDHDKIQPRRRVFVDIFAKKFCHL